MSAEPYRIDVQRIRTAAELALTLCPCTPLQRESGHLVTCYAPALAEAMEPLEQMVRDVSAELGAEPGDTAAVVVTVTAEQFRAREGEPLFTLRAQDRCAPYAVRAWAERARGTGEVPAEKIAGAMERADAMEQWQERTGRARWPD